MHTRFSATKVRRLLACVLCGVLLFLTACTPTDAPGTTTSFEAPASQAPPPAPPQEEPEPDENALPVAFLTGRAKEKDYPEGQRVVAVMVNNIAASRPTAGLSEAKVLIESRIEGDITRFMALYEDYTTLPRVGSIRSLRDQFLQLVLPFQMFVVHNGPSGSQPTTWLIDEFDYRHYDIDGTGFSWVDQNRVAAGMRIEYTQYTDGEFLTEYIEKNGYDTARTYNSPMFSFVPYTDPRRTLEDGEAEAVAVVHSASYRTLFEYDKSTGEYKMSMFNSHLGVLEETIDENNGERLSFDNLLVLFAPMDIYDGTEADGGLKQFDFYGGGGYYFNRGRYEALLWNKGAAYEPLSLISKSGETLQMNPGTTYIAIVSEDNMDYFNEVLFGGDAVEVVAGGETNYNEEEPAD